MSRLMKWIGPASGILLLISCFIPWVYIESRNITITGIDATGTTFGKPGYFHLGLVAFFLVFSFIRRVWAKRVNLLVTALNLAWAIRNYFIISACMGGECPIKKAGLYLLVLSSVLMLLASLFPAVELPEKESS